MSCRYLADRFLPDKAIDLLDEAAASIWLSGGTVDARLEEKKRRLSQELEQAVRDGAYEHAAALRDRLQELVRRQAESSRAQRMLLVTREDVAGIVSQRTGIPAGALSRTEKERLLQLEQALHERVVGQDAAVEAVCRAVRRGRSGMADEERPAASMLFAGPTGVGKTELCKALADVVYGSADSLVRIDMSEYMEPGSVTRLIGAPPGYVGHEEAGTLTEKVRRRPYCVVLLDEVEKAHRDVRNLLLQVMDDGMLTDAMGRTVSFKNAIVVMTSNAGSSEDRKGGLGFLPQEASERFAACAAAAVQPRVSRKNRLCRLLYAAGAAGADGDCTPAAGKALRAGKRARLAPFDCTRCGGGGGTAGALVIRRRARNPPSAANLCADAACRRAAIRTR